MNRPTVSLPLAFRRRVSALSLATTIPLFVIYRPVAPGSTLVRLGLVARDRLRHGDDVAAVVRSGAWRDVEPDESSRIVDASLVAEGLVLAEGGEADDPFEDADGTVNAFVHVDDLAVECPHCGAFRTSFGSYYATTPRGRLVALCDDCGSSLETYRDLDDRLGDLDELGFEFS